MMIKKCAIYLSLISLGVLFTTSCSKDKGMVEATIVDTGDITYEGCGYLLRLNDSALVKPDYLPSHYQHNGMKVKVKYKHTGIEDTCQWGTVLYDRAVIEEIRKYDK